MNAGKRKCTLVFQRLHIAGWVIPFLFFVLFHAGQTYAQDTISYASLKSLPAAVDTTQKLFSGKITNYGFGGLILKFSRFNDQFAFMTGGRGACTINNRYTIGGGGYGIANSIKISGSSPDTTRYFKMGYGGLELGYIFFQGKKVNIGSSLLVAAGAAFWQSKPKNDGENLFGNGFIIFPVLEPSLYSELTLNRFMRLHTGISYRYVNGTDLEYIKDGNMRGFSCYIGLLFGKS
jgi:hypothetical protein